MGTVLALVGRPDAPPSLTAMSSTATPAPSPAPSRIGPVPHQRLGPARLADRSFSRRYEISYRAVKLPRVSAAFERFYLRRGAGLPQVA